MATLRDLRKRLKAVKNTRKITKAMKMVAASKLRRAQQQVQQARPYALRMQEILNHIASRSDVSAHPLLALREPKRIEVLVLSSNRGLCGSFNTNIVRTSERFLKENEHKYDQVDIASMGKKSSEYFKRKGTSLVGEYDKAWDQLKFENAADIATTITGRFRSQELDAVYIIFNEFKSAISQKVVLKQLLPIQLLEVWDPDPNVRVGDLLNQKKEESQTELSEATSTKADPAEFEQPQDFFGYEHIYEPSRGEILDELLPQHIAIQLWRAMLESTAAEHGARMSAMDAASRNAGELIDKLTLQANRVRQANITSELMEIISGAESLA